MSRSQSIDALKSTDLLGHPRGLFPLCVAEAWERFSYFGMQSLLVLYMTHYLLRPEHVHQVVGFQPVSSAIEWFTGPLSTGAMASQIFGLYAGFVYLTPLLGGIVADRWLNRTVTVTIGALLMVLGHFLMAFEASFFFAIVLLLTGVGCFKGNIAGQVGELYPREDLRRATGYQVFQLSISTAVIVSPLVCGSLGEKVGWHFGFAAAGVGMLIGLAVYLHGRRWLPQRHSRSVASAAGRPSLSSAEWKTVLVLIGLLPVLAATMLGNQQMFNAFLIWGEENFDLQLAGFELPVTWLLSFDAVIAVLCLLLVIAFWRAYSKRWKEPDDIVKIAIGAGVMAAAPLLLALASLHQQSVGTRISPGWGLGFELINEIGFAVLIPVGLSLYSRLAPGQLEGFMIGLFYLAFFLSNVTVGRLGGLLEQMNPASFWLIHAGVVAGAAIVLSILAVWGRRFLVPPADAAAQSEGGSQSLGR